MRARLSSLALSPTRENEIVEELSQHLEDRWRELIAGGTTPEEATRLTLADFRNEDLLARQIAPLRQAHPPVAVTPGAPTAHLLGDLRQDLRYAARTMRQRPAFPIHVGPSVRQGGERKAITYQQAISKLADLVLAHRAGRGKVLLYCTGQLDYIAIFAIQEVFRLLGVRNLTGAPKLRF